MWCPVSVEIVICDTATYTDHAKKKTVTAMEVVYANKNINVGLESKVLFLLALFDLNLIHTNTF